MSTEKTCEARANASPCVNAGEALALNVENAVAVSLQMHFDLVKVINAHVSLSCEHMGDDVSQSRWPS